MEGLVVILLELLLEFLIQVGIELFIHKVGLYSYFRKTRVTSLFTFLFLGTLFGFLSLVYRSHVIQSQVLRSIGLVVVPFSVGYFILIWNRHIAKKKFAMNDRIAFFGGMIGAFCFSFVRYIFCK